MPPKWLVAPADAGPRCPGFELLLRRMEHVEEMRCDVAAHGVSNLASRDVMNEAIALLCALMDREVP